ncbi:hypothetical protein J2800_001614 [Caulobacter rhizosphaerae]|uniref:Uncharacterized protein n=1 Tax=Caulobacter rhizosphaerae TaxID=2010972 RepID=A0ABU1MXH1_9CAUL|nr:hypothetical protein [Caulobacter rhizosphaerae]MDR6530875.1 hypothetical protein [Caulobacter rhizosphaerae]
MTSILLALALGAATMAPPAQDQAGNRLEAFAATPPQAPEGAPPLYCTADRDWCAEISRDVDQNTSALHVFAGTPTGQPPAATLDLGSDDNDDLALWPSIVRIAGPESGVIVGVERHVSTSFSGGGGAATQLQLIRVRGDQAKPVLNAPVFGSLLIRACFGERDFWLRRGACHDEYNFAGDLTLDPTTAVGPPRLVFATKATTFPAGALRAGDAARGRLRARDLITVPDPACSYRRIFAFDPASDAYAPDRPLPECEAYTVP